MEKLPDCMRPTEAKSLWGVVLSAQWSAVLGTVLATLATLSVVPSNALSTELDSSVGGYVGQYHDAEPAGVLQGTARFIDHYPPSTIC